jgi:hypothetical protein
VTSGVTISDPRPAAAAHASRCPMFALSDVHCARRCLPAPASREDLPRTETHSTATPAPTYRGARAVTTPAIFLGGKTKYPIQITSIGSPSAVPVP